LQKLVERKRRHGLERRHWCRESYIRGGCIPFPRVDLKILRGDDIPRSVAVEDAIGLDVGVARDPITRGAEALAVNRAASSLARIRNWRTLAGSIGVPVASSLAGRVPGRRPSGIVSVIRVAAPGMIALTVIPYFCKLAAAL